MQDLITIGHARDILGYKDCAKIRYLIKTGKLDAVLISPYSSHPIKLLWASQVISLRPSGI